MIMDYGAFRRAVDYIDGVYVDIDRDYFNDNSSGENYATIDIDPGYQKLRGKDALDYVRYRHTDNDLVRAARQQDFLRQAKNAAGVRRSCSSESASASTSCACSAATSGSTSRCARTSRSSRC